MDDDLANSERAPLKMQSFKSEYVAKQRRAQN